MDARQLALSYDVRTGDIANTAVQLLARTPFPIEFQFDVRPDGAAGQTFGASVQFAAPSKDEDRLLFEAEGAVGDLMSQIEGWGLADERWRLLDQTTFSMRLSRDGESTVAVCYPAFLKLRWRAGEPLDAKAYLIAGIR